MEVVIAGPRLRSSAVDRFHSERCPLCFIVSTTAPHCHSLTVSFHGSIACSTILYGNITDGATSTASSGKLLSPDTATCRDAHHSATVAVHHPSSHTPPVKPLVAPHDTTPAGRIVDNITDAHTQTAASHANNQITTQTRNLRPYRTLHTRAHNARDEDTTGWRPLDGPACHSLLASQALLSS